MRLIELNPKIDNYGGLLLSFDCPKCRAHRLEIPMEPHPKGWKRNGDTLEKLSLTPSIAHENLDADDSAFSKKPLRKCESHFFITKGNIVMA